MASSSDAATGLAILAVAVADERLDHDELRQVVEFVVGAYHAGEPDAIAKHTGRLLTGMIVKARRDDLAKRFEGRNFSERDAADLRRGLAEMDELWPRTRGGAPAKPEIDAKATSAAILKAHRKATTAPVVELPSNPIARAVIVADMKARNETPGGER